MMSKSAGRNSRAGRVLIVSYSLTLFWLGVIFYLSAQVATESNELSTGITEKIVAVIEQVVPQAEIDTGGLNHFVRKNAHFAAYLLLGILTANCFYLSWIFAGGGQSPDADEPAYASVGRTPGYLVRPAMLLRSWSRQRIWLAAWLFCVFYAITDELHQFFVPGRGCQVQDVLIDSTGAAVGIMIYLLIRRVTSARKGAEAASGNV